MSRFAGPTLPPGKVADVTLLLEGTYPFVSGGVSSWVHQIIRGLPEITFSLVFIGSSPDRYRAMRYTLPKNVVHLEEHFLSDLPSSQRARVHEGNRDFYVQSARLHDAFRDESTDSLEQALQRVVAKLVAEPARHERDFLFSERAWTEISRRYERASPDRSFLEYFWSIRSMHAPLFIAARAAKRVPPSRAFHVISTGFAGFLGMLLRSKRRRPLVLTEHGIYTKERRIELLQANWITEDDHVAPDTEDVNIGFFRQLWIRFFETLGRMTYAAADPIIALYEGTRARQIKDGAPASRTRVVPNGIALDRFAPLRALRNGQIPPVLGLIGRVVPIKDIKTFLRAMRVVCGELPDAEGWIVGPEDEDPSYAQECRHLTSNLGLQERVRFLGFKKVEEVFPRLGINVLTSISEAQPLVVLEGFAAGVPCVATDVGCCRELIEGAGPEDRALGTAGAVVAIADPDATARSAVALLRDPARWSAAQRAGIARVEGFYTERLMLDRYRAIYRTALEA
jgi:glycosyltransferase involved in cell wall biosynthesis